MLEAAFRNLLVGALALGATASAAETASMRLEWVMQGQFAGPILALERGYYREAGVEMTLNPAGPDIKPAVTVATGVDTFGIGHPNQIIAARANGAPLVQIAQFGQKSATTYVARKDSGIETIADVKGRSVGLWFGGDEHEFLAMLNAAGIAQSEVNLISQGYDIVSWMNGDYDVMQVTIYGELPLLLRQGFKREDLVFLDPSEQGVALVNTGLFTTERMIAEKPEVVQAVLDATMRGWREALADPQAAAEIVVKYNPELTVPDQVEMIRAMGELFCAGPTLEGRFGENVMADWETSQAVLLGAKLIEAPVDLSAAFTNRFWEAAPAEYKQIACGG
jgi:NitT/TauT family transport system substrate-binding protein